MADLIWEIATQDDDVLSQLIGDHGLSRPAAMVMANRRTPLDEVESFLRPRLSNLTDPYLISGMERAAGRIWQAVRDREQIIIHGDYDVDGVTSSTLLAWVLRESGAEVRCFVPHRKEDGYGLTPHSVAKAAAGSPCLLITVDCGINSYEATVAANELGIDVIITDHHEPREILPPAHTVINPKLCDNLQNLHNLAGVGVAFKLCHAFLKYGLKSNLGGMVVDLKEGLDLVALGTVADIVPLLSENRCLVKHGMRVLAAQRRPGIRALCEIAKLPHRIKATDITYRLAPRLNAAGRMGDAANAVKLLQAESIVEAHTLAGVLDECNRDRQVQEQETLAAAEAQITDRGLLNKATIVVHGHDWHLGVIGIVASRLVQSYHRPCVVLSINNDGETNGSGRSIDGINLVEALNDCQEHLSRYGGHPMASGVSLPEKNLPQFDTAFEESIRRQYAAGPDRFKRRLKLEGDIRFDLLDDQFFAELDDLQPFGHGHPAPRFRFRHVHCDRLQLAGRRNTRGTLSDGTGVDMPFIAFGQVPEDFPESPWDIAACPEMNEYHGNCHPQIQLQEVRSA